MKKYPLLLSLIILLSSCGSKNSVDFKNVKKGNLEFFETYNLNEITPNWHQAILVSKTLGQDTSASDSIQNSIPLNDLRTLDLSKLVQYVGDYTIGYVAIENRDLVDSILQSDQIKKLFPKDLRFMWSAYPEKTNTNSREAFMLYAAKIPWDKKAIVNGKHILGAETGVDENTRGVFIDLQMTNQGAEIWREMTTNNVGRIILITMENKIFSAPRVNEPITGGKTSISGSFTFQEAKSLAARINAGSRGKKIDGE